MSKEKLNVAVVGATGYAGCELIKILLVHPEVAITSVSGKVEKAEKISEIFPLFKGRLDLVCGNVDVPAILKAADLIFLALPHKVSMLFVPDFLKAGKKVVDLSADYRLKDAGVYEKWYGAKHTSAALLKDAVYGLPELYKKEIARSKFIANPGCYPTGSILGCAPLVSKGFVDTDQIIIDAKSGVTGAGRTASLALNFAELNENFKAYKINQHQHMPEIDQELSGAAGSKIGVTFTPHLVPMNKGILSTIYFTLKEETGTADLLALYKRFYKDAPFVRILDEGVFPETKNVYSTNFCDIGIKVTGKRAIVVTAIDNLWKGAASQAVQNMNLMMGFDETAGLI
ncbi:MAG: N-acetyl-gamma-glutamyl-phosphate reductase [Candidatus Omnitrophica bacterium]|nr:N-acetyl-gamma-glutamyl-phosphate reductase [Candidatus Omnitrophota bacterium]MDD5310364.1 N-acetyl-gamma-glutamyl-phosphate reductase [Candidatus Omnitrophota bacterium]